MFASSLGDSGSIASLVIPKTQKMVLGAALLDTKYYKEMVKGKLEQIGVNWKVQRPPLHLGVVAIETGAFGSPLT